MDLSYRRRAPSLNASTATDAPSSDTNAHGTAPLHVRFPLFEDPSRTSSYDAGVDAGLEQRLQIMIRRLQVENERLTAVETDLRRDNAHLRNRVEALETHHAMFADGVAEATEASSANIAALSRRVERLAREVERIEEARARSVQTRRAVPLAEAVAAAIHAHPELFAPDAFCESRGTMLKPAGPNRGLMAVDEPSPGCSRH